MKTILFIALLNLLSLCVFAEEDPLDVQLGEKLFLEDRFAQSFFVKSQGNYNQLVSEGDPVLEMLNAPGGLIEHPHRGRQVSCASCHFVDQASQFKENLVFTYNDFSRRSLIPLRQDASTRTLRNSQNMVSTSFGKDRPLHWDGEFFSAKGVSCAALAGRNMGWLPDEGKLAYDHLVNVLREDDGSYPTDSDIKVSYSQSFKELGFDFKNLSDQQIKNKACEVMAAYLQDIDFSRDEYGSYNGSAYDQFLTLNNIRRSAKSGESSAQYLQYLRNQVLFKEDWKWLAPKDLQYHGHSSKFGPLEMQGMKTFFTRAQCATCHTPPNFTNDGFHRTGISQFEYDSVHGRGAFAKLSIPSWSERKKMQKKYLTATATHPLWKGVFAKIPQKDEAEFVDLGAWNVLGHPDKVSVQTRLKKALCFSERMANCDDWSNNDYLKRSQGSFKTPTLRSLGQSAPYFHNGMSKNLFDVLAVYMATSRLVERGDLVNPDPMLRAMKIRPPDFEPLKAFMESLDEDYD